VRGNSNPHFKASTQYAAASPARTSVSPERAQALKASAAAYGKSTPELLARLGPDTSSLKMSARCYQEAMNMNFQMTDAYAAGLIDGEGCISIAHRNERVFYPRIDVGMGLKGLPVLEALMATYGGSIQITRRQSEKWEEARAWRLFGRPLEKFLAAILPHLLLKRQQAEYALALQKMIGSLPRRPNGSASWTEQATKDAKVIRGLMSELNRKGPPQHSQSAGWFARLVGETWITDQRDLASPHGWEEFSRTWPRSGILRNFTVSALPPLVRLTDETDFGLWPTPHGFSPDGKSNGPSGNELGRAVNQAMWPTPNTVDAKGGTRIGSGQAQLCHQVGGSLNPTWVEWLMGFPLEWTALDR